MNTETKDQILRALKYTVESAKNALDGGFSVAALLLDDIVTRPAPAPADRPAAHSSGAKAEMLLTVKQAAEMLQVSPRSIYAWVEEGKLQARRAGGKIRFLRAELLIWSEEQQQRRTISARRSGMRVAR